MHKLIILFFSVLLLLISGCSNQAEKGKGGFAEHDLTNMPNHPVGLENALFFEQQLSSRHLDTLILSGAKICFPASVRTAEIRQNRISRELQGGLETDAANDMIIQRDKLARLERRLNYVQLQGSCLPNDMAKVAEKPAAQANQAPLSSAEIIKIQSLLNNNNQFVSDSTQLNPRYIGHLSEVSILLRPHPEYHLKVIGHADNKGTEADNLKLSLQRAQQVERYLQIFGLNPNNITIAGNGEKTPLFNGDEAQVRLVNRRVSIELIHAARAQEVTSK
jgi:outer membrane protein OmpA-like peptidoglycan-associated protein